MAKIRVMIIDDSLVFREFLSRALSADPSMEVAATFADPQEALEKISRVQPDVIAVDMEMSTMRGSDFLRKALPRHPYVKAVIISSLSGNVFDAIQAGATDFVGKPGSRPGYSQQQFIADIIQKIKIAAAARPALPEPPHAHITPAPGFVTPVSSGLNGVTSRSLIAIGASTGGTEAILDVIKHFPADTPGVVIVQHMPPGFTQMYADRVDKSCPMTVREAKNGDKVERGLVLIAPGGDQHMRVRRDGAGYSVTLSAGPKVNGHCPSVDVLFESVAKAAGPAAVGVILTGMGGDGAHKLCEMRKAGAHTIGQDQESCIVYGMPKVAYDLGGVAQQLPLGSIAGAVLRCFAR